MLGNFDAKYMYPINHKENKTGEKQCCQEQWNIPHKIWSSYPLMDMMLFNDQSVLTPNNEREKEANDACLHYVGKTGNNNGQ